MIEAIRNGNVVELDVREMLKVGNDPFQVIMDTVENLKEGDTFILYAIFNPIPLIGKIEQKGYKSNSEELGEKNWKITFSK